MPQYINRPVVLYVTGADLYISNDIIYTSLTDNPSMVIIVQKLNGKGGNIFIDPAVKQIDATLIADGALMNGVKSGTTIAVKDWISNI